ncbi:MAG: hypothetical protein VCC04_08780 [Myxococcota bacterium]
MPFRSRPRARRKIQHGGRAGPILVGLGTRTPLFACWLGVFAVAVGVGLGGTSAAAAQTKCALEPGRSVRHVKAGGLDRRVLVEVGPRAGVDSPLVIIWHGWGGRPEHMFRVIDPARDWPEAIVVAPEGEPRRFPGLGFSSHPGWQISEGEFDNRDLELFDRLMKEFLATGCVDPKRVFSTGFSNGGFFSNLLGCTRSPAIRAIAPVSGGIRARGCKASVPAIVVHGSRDSVVPYEDGQKTFAHWVEQNGCDSRPEIVSKSCVAAENCGSETIFCSFNGDHRWPRSLTPTILEFLQRQ